jgi:hypothetical protein
MLCVCVCEREREREREKERECVNTFWPIHMLFTRTRSEQNAMHYFIIVNGAGKDKK